MKLWGQGKAGYEAGRKKEESYQCVVTVTYTCPHRPPLFQQQSLEVSVTLKLWSSQKPLNHFMQGTNRYIWDNYLVAA
jgi:hypothetical protein